MVCLKETIRKKFFTWIISGECSWLLQGIVVTWDEAVFSRVDTWVGQFSAVAKLKRQTDDFEIVVVSAYGPTNATKRKVNGGSWRELYPHSMDPGC